MDIVKKSIKEAVERLEGMEFYESWADGKLSEILDKLKSAEKDIQNLQDTVRSTYTMPSLKETGTADGVTPDYRDQWRYERSGGEVLPAAGYVTPDYRDQWRYEPQWHHETNGFKLHREVLKMSDRTETTGDAIAKEWAKFMETASPDDKVKALTEIVRTLTPETSV